MDIIREVYPEAGITADTPVLIVSKKYVQDISGLFFNNDPGLVQNSCAYVNEEKTKPGHCLFRALNNFIMWKLADGLVPYLSAQFRAVYDLYHVDITGESELFIALFGRHEYNFSFCLC